MNGDAGKPPSEAEIRRRRLEQALRDNLRKRKAQARERSAPAPEGDPAQPGGEMSEKGSRNDP